MHSTTCSGVLTVAVPVSDQDAAKSLFERLGVSGRLVSARTTYRLAGREWVQNWTAEDVDDATLAVEAAAAVLTLAGALDADGWWVRLGAA